MIQISKTGTTVVPKGFVKKDGSSVVKGFTITTFDISSEIEFMGIKAYAKVAEISSFVEGFGQIQDGTTIQFKSMDALKLSWAKAGLAYWSTTSEWVTPEGETKTTTKWQLGTERMSL